MKKISRTVKTSGKTTLVFFGSGPVAAKSLELLAPYFTIEAVITKPRPLHHRGSVPVLEAAKTLSLPIITVSNKKELDDIINKKLLKSRLGALIDFGIIVGQETIDYFPLGIVNSHFSLLPEWRGADPITFAVLSGQKQTGVSLMLLVQAMDEGPLLAQSPYDLSPTTTTPQLTEDLVQLSIQMLKEIIPLYVTGTIQPVLQGELVEARGAPSYSRKLTKQDGIIEWTKPAAQIEREIRAFLGWPGSHTNLFGKDLILTSVEVVNEQGKPGVAQYDKNRLVVYCGRGALSILKLKPSGKKEMPIKAFLAGLR